MLHRHGWRRAFGPGLRPGPATARRRGYVLTRLTAAGSVYLAAIALFPTIVLGELRVSSQLLFSGSSLLIVVRAGLDTVKQGESQLRQHRSGGFVRPVPGTARKIPRLAGTPRAQAALNEA